MKNLSAGVALSLLFVFAAGEIPQPSFAVAAETETRSDEQRVTPVILDLMKLSPTFRILSDGRPDKLKIRMMAPQGEESVKSLYGQFRAMRNGMIAVDIEDASNSVHVVNRLIDGVIDAYQVQQGLSPYVLGLNPYQVVFGMEPALGAQAMTIKLAIMLELDAAQPGKGYLQATAKKNEEFAAALAAYRANETKKGAAVELPALLSAYKAMLRGENHLSLLRAGKAVSDLERLYRTDATKEEVDAVRPFYIQELPLERLGEIPGYGNLFALERREKIWPVLGERHLTGKELADSFGAGLEKWYKDNYGKKYGDGGSITAERAMELKKKTIYGLAAQTDYIASLFGDMMADKNQKAEPSDSPAPRPML